MRASATSAADFAFGPQRTAIKTAWQSAKKRTQRHCPMCKKGMLVDREKPARGYVCGECNHETDELPKGLEGLRLHDLRHSAVTRMVAARVPLTTIAKIVGWSNSTTIAMAYRYSHPEEDEMRQAVEAISGFSKGSCQFPRQSERTAEGMVN